MSFHFIPPWYVVPTVPQLVGGAQHVSSDPLSISSMERLGNAPAGARAMRHTHDRADTRAPIGFDCPHFPNCECPGGVARPECPKE